MNSMPKTRKISIEIDDELRGTVVYVDQDHLGLIFKNLLENSFRATEIRSMDINDLEMVERVQVALETFTDQYVILRFSDNGRGIPQSIRSNLYIKECSDRDNSEGIGGLIIGKFLNLNGGSIEILETITSGPETGTLQRMILPLREDGDRSGG
jgi:nitrogen fixation/metabolism regulation signal transduction histidine kinase